MMTINNLDKMCVNRRCVSFNGVERNNCWVKKTISHFPDGSQDIFPKTEGGGNKIKVFHTFCLTTGIQ